MDRTDTAAGERAAVGAVIVPRVPTIDVFRGVAILLVILYHISGNIIFPTGWGLQRDAAGVAHLAGGSQLLRFLFLPFHLGRVGVNLFFVISGLCIHMRFAAERARDPGAAFSLRTFFLRRFFRIYPVYWAALAIGIVVGPFIYAAALTGSIPESGVHFPTLGSVGAHFVMLHPFFKTYILDILRVLWSIGTEEQFYLLYPLVFVLIGRSVDVPRLVLALLAVTIAWRAAFVLTNPAPASFSDGPFLVWLWGFSLSRYYEWSLGALLAWALANRRTLELFPYAPFRFLGARPRLVMAMGIGFILLGAASLARARIKWMIEDPCYSTGWFLVLASAMLPSTARREAAWSNTIWARAFRAVRAWATRRLERLGRRSFSVYLLHELSLMTSVALMHRYNLPPIAVAAPLTGLLTWALCYPFYAYVEAPFERLSKSVGRAQRGRADRPAGRRVPGAIPSWAGAARPTPASPAEPPAASDA